ncbi:AAA family ATPase [Burkholderia stagnalis]|uniref:AAA family ATPase n=1 Tax=Burkholderia stagnalis TaxID=1503054 RepID=UPI000F5A1A74|nr:AAA family ATPase [Burkholderia stagnalis]RQQ21299.1 AAA family ATPase [Burkholderia stagnalis]RQY84950.1 AAA family ATPase [Burkholderia stagnalis]
MLEKLEKIRELTAEELGIPSSEQTPSTGSPNVIDLVSPENEASAEEQLEMVEPDDAVYLRILQLLDDGFGGVILTGPPGTGKSRAARRIAARLAGGDRSRLFFIQFHPAYQYEDFIEAYVPTEQGGFELADKTFLLACKTAVDLDDTVVVVLDELSRTDVIRVFGEVLTYLEPSKRGFSFMLASGREAIVPKKLVIVATMNPWDRGVEELDLAFERRFAKIALEPDVAALNDMLRDSTLSEQRKQKLERFFLILHRHPNPLCRLGHAYFQTVRDDASLMRLWENQLTFHFDRVLKRSPDELASIRSAWENVITD